jgi:hypothetical protein
VDIDNRRMLMTSRFPSLLPDPFTDANGDGWHVKEEEKIIAEVEESEGYDGRRKNHDDAAGDGHVTG